jgi:hypothetical protein
MRFDTIHFANELKSAAGLSDIARVRELVREVIANEELEIPVDDEGLILNVAQRIDAADQSPLEMLQLGHDLGRLMLEAASKLKGIDLIPVIAERTRFASVLRKHLNGALSRTSVLSYLAEQRFPGILRERLRSLSDRDFGSLLLALEKLDIRSLEVLLT